MKEIKQYHVDSITNLKKRVKIHNSTVAVLGCSTGADCRLIIDEGAISVVGVDLDDRIGQDYKDEKIRYLKTSVSSIPVESNQFDIVYSLATFEHVHDIEPAYNEAVRICKKDGTIFIVSSPLWCSPFGHHYKDLLEKWPWIHLMLGPHSLNSFLQEQGFEIFQGKTIDSIVDYIYNNKNFNHFPGSYYLSVCNQLKNVKIIENKLNHVNISELASDEFYKDAVKMGFSEMNLLASSHMFYAKKLKAT